MRIYMQTPPIEEQAPRFYQIYLERDLLQGWMVTKEWGHVGASGRLKHEHYDSLEAAEKAFEDARESQLKRGYRIVFTEGHGATNRTSP